MLDFSEVFPKTLMHFLVLHERHRQTHSTNLLSPLSVPCRTCRGHTTAPLNAAELSYEALWHLGCTISLQHGVGDVIVKHSVGAIILLLLVFSTIAAVPQGQALEASPTILTFTAVQGLSNPVTQAVVLLKNNPRERNWATWTNAAWLSVTVSPANLVPSDRLLVSVDVGGLPAGVYTGMVSIAGMKGEPVSIPVTLTITARTLTRPTLSAFSTATTPRSGTNTDLD